MGLLITILSAVLRFLAAPVIAGLLVWGGAGFWLMSLDRGDFAVRHREWVAGLNGQADHLRGAMGDIDKRKNVIAEEISAQEARAVQAGKVVSTLHDLESTWDRYVGNPEQQKANAEQVRRMEELKTRAQASAEELRREFRRKVWERDGLEIDLARVQEQIDFAQAHDSRFVFYTDKAWTRFRWAILAAPVLYLTIGWLWRMRALWRRIPDARPKRE